MQWPPTVVTHPINGRANDKCGLATSPLPEFCNLEKAAASVALFTTHLKTASERLNEKDNIAGILLNDSTSAAAVKITLKNLETSSKKLDEDLEALQHNIFLRGFFRKKAKAAKE